MSPALVLKQGPDGPRERLRVALGNEEAGHAVLDGDGEPAHARGHDGDAGRHRLQRHHAERLVARGHQTEVGGLVVVG